jgi:hypothetical protein
MHYLLVRHLPMRQVAAAAKTAAILIRSGVAASRLIDFLLTIFLGLTPQAMRMSPLRGFSHPTGFGRLNDEGRSFPSLRLSAFAPLR